MDTAGIRETDNEIERIGIEKAKEHLSDADLVLMIIDVSKPLSTEDKELLAGIKSKKTVLILNKTDLERGLTDEEYKEFSEFNSRTISKQYDMGVSSATVRNEMSDLEELGFLNKVYSSSGRIPSDKAYRHYVNYLLSSHFDEISKNIYGIDILSKHINEKNKIFKESAKIISDVTECITATMITNYMDCSVKSIDVINISGNSYVLVLVFDTGKVISTVFDSKTKFSTEVLQELLFYLKKYLINVKVSDLNERLEYLKLTFVSKIPFITEISDLIGKEISKTEKSSIELEGISNIFNFPEYQDLKKAKELIHFLEDKNELERRRPTRSRRCSAPCRAKRRWCRF